MLKRHLAPQMLERLLKNELLDTRDQSEKGIMDKVRRFLSLGGDDREEA